MSTLTHAPNISGEMISLRNHNDELVALNGTLLVKIAQLEIERAHWKSQSEFDMRQKIAVENKNFATIDDHLDELEKRLREADAKNLKLTERVNTLKELQQESESYIKEKERAEAEMHTDLETARREKEEMKQRLEEFRGDWAATCRATTDFRREKYELEDKVAKLEREVRTYKADTKELEDELENLRKEEPTSVEYHRMEMDVEDMQEENAMLRHTIDNLRRAHSEDVDTLKKSKDVMRNDLVTEHNRVVEEFKKSETKLVSECCEMSNKVAELKDLVDHMRSAIACLSGLVGK
jgi:chromosome segregation ATPase